MYIYNIYINIFPGLVDGYVLSGERSRKRCPFPLNRVSFLCHPKLYDLSLRLIACVYVWVCVVARVVSVWIIYGSRNTRPEGLQVVIYRFVKPWNGWFNYRKDPRRLTDYSTLPQGMMVFIISVTISKLPDRSPFRRLLRFRKVRQRGSTDASGGDRCTLKKNWSGISGKKESRETRCTAANDAKVKEEGRDSRMNGGRPGGRLNKSHGLEKQCFPRR